MANPDPTKFELPNDLIPETRQICIVTRDLDAMVRRYADQLGIGPWWVNEYKAPDLFDTTYRGQPAAYSMRLALAWTGALNWEIIQPLEGPSIYRDYLERNQEGVQHVGVMLSDLGLTWDECHETFHARGFEPIQEGRWKRVSFCYYDTLAASGTIIEVIDRPADFARPEPEYWYPAQNA
ncbi:MAG: methylmalonyl-CoA epimerase [Rhodospirillaceae bacterium]|nr:methylmalonyl-CoA epimerase [Rhodospirillaceae bacterium]